MMFVKEGDGDRITMKKKRKMKKVGGKEGKTERENKEKDGVLTLHQYITTASSSIQVRRNHPTNFLV